MSKDPLVVPFKSEETPEMKKWREKYWDNVSWMNYMLKVMFRK